jgi:hypothetical protein
MSAEEVYQEILEMPVEEREKLFILIARRGFMRETSEKPKKKGLARFCGKWQDEREAEEIVTEIYGDRLKNI